MDRMKVKALVTLRLFPASEGGRRSPIRSGYQPVLWLDGTAVDPSRLCFGNEDWIQPGESVQGTLEFLTPRSRAVRYDAGSRFELREAIKPVGEGEIVKVLEAEPIPAS